MTANTNTHWPCPRCGRHVVTIEDQRCTADPGGAAMDDVERNAHFSPCKTWRYTLSRRWNLNLPMVTFVLLNPSTADALHDDPTNRRGMGFARSWGFGACVFVNLFAFRSPYPKVMKASDDPVGPDNDEWILRCAVGSDLVVCAWGVNGVYRGRDLEVLEILNGFKLRCLGLTKAGYPRHPLYLKKDTELERFPPMPNFLPPSNPPSQVADPA